MCYIIIVAAIACSIVLPISAMRMHTSYIVHCRSVAGGMHRIRGRWQYYVLAFRGETT